MRERRIIYTRLAAEGDFDFLVLVAEKLAFILILVVTLCLEFLGYLKALIYFLK